MRIDRVWAMPSSATFTIKPIADLIREEMAGGVWIDPCCGANSPAAIRNDLNPNVEAEHHVEALAFLKQFADSSVDGVLFDPPYSPRQVAECYKQFGLSTMRGELTKATFWSDQKDEIARIVKPEGKVICCGWNSMGIGINRGFLMTRVLLVPHGGNHNDTIVTVETKVQWKFDPMASLPPTLAEAVKRMFND